MTQRETDAQTTARRENEAPKTDAQATAARIEAAKEQTQHFGERRGGRH